MKSKSKSTQTTNKELVDKTFEFSLSLLELYITLVKNNEFELSEKLLKSGTCIRENVEESIAAVSKQDFFSKMSLAYTEAIETRYWLKLIQMKHLINNACDNCVDQVNEIIITLNYMSQVKNKFNVKLNIQNLN